MARPETLVPGNCYFFVGYYDMQGLLPNVHTVVYVRQDKTEDGQDIWIFQEPAVELPENIEEQDQDTPSVITFDEDNLNMVIDFGELLLVIKQDAEYHPINRVEGQTSPLGINQAARAELEQRIRKLLADSDLISLTITIRYTVNGFSIGQKAGNIEMSFYPRPKIDPNPEIRIRHLFDERGLKPQRDYLSDKGRTRSLSFSIPNDFPYLIELSVRVLSEVYGVRTNDALKFAFLHRTEIEGNL